MTTLREIRERLIAEQATSPSAPPGCPDRYFEPVKKPTPRLMRDEQVRIDDAILYCPRCGSCYLHQCGVNVYWRGEDAEKVVLIETAGASVQSRIAPSEPDNPSKRRDGIAIRFWCEHCGGNTPDNVLELTLAQHKGVTLVEWRYT